MKTTATEVIVAIQKTKKALDFKSNEINSSTKIKRYARSIDVEVYPQSVPRALLLLKTILHEAYKIQAIPKLHGIRYWFRFKERDFKFHVREEIDHRWIYDRTYRGRAGTGRLIFSLYPPHSYPRFDHRLPPNGKTWSDNETGKLENKVGEIIASFSTMLEIQLEKEDREAKEAEKRAIEDRLWQIEEDKKNSAKGNLQDILKATRLWRRAREIETFLAEVKNRLPQPYERDTDAWIDLCQKVINAADPFKEGPKPWETLTRAKHNNEMRAFIALNKLDPHDEYKSLITKNSGKTCDY